MSERLMIEWRLSIGNRFTGLVVCPDPQWPNMWRIHFGGRISDMVNLARAKDAAIAWTRPRGLGGRDGARWDYRETPARAFLASAAEVAATLPPEDSTE